MNRIRWTSAELASPEAGHRTFYVAYQAHSPAQRSVIVGYLTAELIEPLDEIGILLNLAHVIRAENRNLDGMSVTITGWREIGRFFTPGEREQLSVLTSPLQPGEGW
jgi:hypothetical protein